MTVSFDAELLEAIRESTSRGDQSVSAWLAEAARDRLRFETLGGAVAAWEEQFGPLTEDELAGADQRLSGACRLTGPPRLGPDRPVPPRACHAAASALA